MDKLKVHISAGGNARMSPLWWVEMSLEKIVSDILDHLNLRYQGSLLFGNVEDLVLKELTYTPIGRDALQIGGDIDGAIKRGLHDRNIGLGPEAGFSKSRTYGKIAGQTHDVIEGSCDSDEHQKVFKSGNINGLMSTWICSICGVRGSDPVEFKKDEYEELVDKFHS